MIADSRDVARVFEKEHKDVLRAIRNLSCSQDFRGRNFAPLQNQTLSDPNYGKISHIEMPRDGFSRLVMSFTGEKAAIWIERYIEAFNKSAEAQRAGFVVMKRPTEVGGAALGGEFENA